MVKLALIQLTVHFGPPNVISVGKLGISKRCVSLGKLLGVGALQIPGIVDKSLHKQQNSNHKSVRAVQNETEGQTDEYPLHIVTSPAPTKPIMLEVTVNNQSVSMELDTGSAVSLVSEHTFKSKWPDTHLQISPVKLRTYSNESLQVLGQVEANM